MRPSASASCRVFPLADPPVRLLLDENLASRAAHAVADAFPGSQHVGDAGLLGAADHAIWDYALANGFVLVSKDEDFHRMSVLRGPPVKVVWIRIGNCSTDELIELLRSRRAQKKSFVADQEAGFLALA